MRQPASPPDGWDPAQYDRFAAARAQPFWDLAGLVRGPVDRLADLGCGSGDLTVALAARLGATDVVGLDSSTAMLERAARHRRAGVRFEHGDIASWCRPGELDLVFANASLHWVPDHATVLGRWTAALRPGGQLAVQVPANADHPSHRSAVEVASTEPFVSAMGGSPPPDPVAANVLDPARYAEVLHELGFIAQHVRVQVYGHVLDSSADVVEWVKGSTLTRFFRALPADLHEPFVEAYRRRLLERIGERSPYFYPFKRILLWAVLGDGTGTSGADAAGR